MILVTVGMQLGFDRLIKAMDQLAPSLGQDIVAQTGKGAYLARNLLQHSSIEPREFEKLVAQASLIVSHAGIGTILSAQRASKPIVLFPRRAALGEHRNDHQLATCRQLEGRDGIGIAFEEYELPEAISLGLEKGGIQRERAKPHFELERAVRHFIETGTI